MNTEVKQSQTMTRAADMAGDALSAERRPYVAPQMDSVGGPMATLLASACQTCAVCNNPDDPLFQT